MAANEAAPFLPGEIFRTGAFVSAPCLVGVGASTLILAAGVINDLLRGKSSQRRLATELDAAEGKVKALECKLVLERRAIEALHRDHTSEVQRLNAQIRDLRDSPPKQLPDELIEALRFYREHLEDAYDQFATTNAAYFAVLDKLAPMLDEGERAAERLKEVLRMIGKEGFGAGVFDDGGESVAIQLPERAEDVFDSRHVGVGDSDQPDQVLKRLRVFLAPDRAMSETGLPWLERAMNDLIKALTAKHGQLGSQVGRR